MQWATFLDSVLSRLSAVWQRTTCYNLYCFWKAGMNFFILLDSTRSTFCLYRIIEDLRLRHFGYVGMLTYYTTPSTADMFGVELLSQKGLAYDGRSSPPPVTLLAWNVTSKSSVHPRNKLRSWISWTPNSWLIQLWILPIPNYPSCPCSYHDTVPAGSDMGNARF